MIRLSNKMDSFIFYDLVNDTVEDDVKSKINVDLLLEDVPHKGFKKDAIMSQIDVAKSIIKELIKIEKSYKNLNIIDLYNLDIINFSKDFPDYKIKLKLDVDYYPMLTPDISLYPIIDPILMYEMISVPELDIRNTSKIRNIEYIIYVINKFLLDNRNRLECKLNNDITDMMILLLKNNNYKMKSTEINTNKINTNKKNSGIGYGIYDNTKNTWDVNGYLNNLSRIKNTNKELLNKIITFLDSNKDNKDLNEIHTRFNLNTFWIDLIEKYEITDEKYYESIKDIFKIVKYLELKIKIPFFDTFKSIHQENSESVPLIKEIINYINDIQIKDVVDLSSTDEYVNTLQKVQMGDYLYVLKEKHYFVKEVKEFVNFTHSGTPKIIMRQLEMITRSIPISKDNTVFIRRDTTNVSVFKFMIIPNEDTPYKFGCFVFDVLLPANFPNVSPLVNHSTSRKNSFRFNPNLYHCGKVCLSLLGTWGGHQSENWISPNAEGTGSTLMQLILSIYSMIFTEDPWYNEPGREGGIKDAKTNMSSIAYNKEIQTGTIKFAILNQLRYPEEGFDDAIKSHFRLKKDKIYNYLLETDKKYAEEFLKLLN
jgi:ubiquitin-protein ligase